MTTIYRLIMDPHIGQPPVGLIAQLVEHCTGIAGIRSVQAFPSLLLNRPNRLTQCCTQFKSPGFKILCVLYLHYNLAFTCK